MQYDENVLELMVICSYDLLMQEFKGMMSAHSVFILYSEHLHNLTECRGKCTWLILRGIPEKKVDIP